VAQFHHRFCQPRYISHLSNLIKVADNLAKENLMASTPIHGFLIPATASAMPVSRPRPRRISSEAGHALEILGHAIEYLSNEFIHDGGFSRCSNSWGSGELANRNGQMQAMQLLMALNRQVYRECPAVPTLGDRLRALLGAR
jgi:hypothetical protein